MKRTLVAALAGLFVVVSGAGPAAAAVGDWYKGDGHMSIAYGLAYIENDEGNETGHRMMFVKDALDWLSLEGLHGPCRRPRSLRCPVARSTALRACVCARTGWLAGRNKRG